MTKIKMALALDKLIKDVKEEKILWKENQPHTADEEESAWNRVATKNMLTGGEAKSIFKVLCKKYRQEAQKPVSSWQLFSTLKFLDEKCSTADDEPLRNELLEETALSPASNNEEETFVELLEVKDEDFSEDGGYDDDDGGDNNYDKKVELKGRVSSVTMRKEIKSNTVLLNSEANQKQHNASVVKASHHHDNNKSIEKQQQHNNISKDNSNSNLNNSNSTSNSGHHNNNSSSSASTGGASTAANADKPITLPMSITIKKEKENNTTPVSLSSIMNSLKRKCPSDSGGVQNSTGSNCGNTTTGSSSMHNGTNQKDSDLQHDIPEKRRFIRTPSSSPGQNQSKQQKPQQQHQQRLSAQELIKSIHNNDTRISPPAPTTTESSATVKSQMTASTSQHQSTTQSSASSPRIFNNNSKQNINTPNNLSKTNQNELINDEHKKFNSFGHYVATTMIRLRPKLAAKLENKILQAIIDINSEMMDHHF